ncbi:MAG: hypothetical protein JJT77_12210 [Crocinitomicaceae bacterium]|nr:hypothetical protein [Crocinitomicaceae bacterium]
MIKPTIFFLFLAALLMNISNGFGQIKPVISSNVYLSASNTNFYKSLQKKLSDSINFYDNNGQIVNAVYFNKQLQNLSLIAHDWKQYHFSFNDFGIFFGKLGMFDQAIEHFQQSILYFINTEDYKSLIAVKQNYADLLVKMNQSEKALEQLYKSIDLFALLEEKDSIVLAVSYTNIAFAILAKESKIDIDMARSYLYKSIAIAENSQHLYALRLKGINLINISYCYREENDFDRAVNCIDSAEVLFKKIENSHGMGLVLLNRAIILERLGLHEKALNLAQKAFVKFQQIQQQYYELQALDTKISAYKSLKRFEDVIRLQEYKIELNNEIQAQKNGNIIKLTELEASLENAKRENQMLATNNELVMEKKNSAINQLRFYFTLALLMLTSALFLLIIYRKNLRKRLVSAQIIEKEKQLLELTLRNQKLELQNYAQLYAEKNKILDEIELNMQEIGSDNRFSSSEIDAVTKKLKMAHQLDQDKKEVFDKLSEFDQEFKHKLMARHPDLTKKDVRLAQLINADIEIKEMAIILNLEINSVRVSKKRLRKKLALEAYEDIRSYFQSL